MSSRVRLAPEAGMATIIGLGAGAHVKTIRSRTMLSRETGECLVYVHTIESPSDSEWDAALELLRARNDMGSVRVLVYTAGGAPNAAQRARLNHVLEKTKPPISVLTASTFARAAGTAISWFNPMFKIFGPDDFDPALDHLGLRGVERLRAREALLDMKRDLLSHASVAAR